MIFILVFLCIGYALDCSEYGKEVQLLNENYYCDGKQVTKESYDTLVSTNNCGKIEYNTIGCMCPEDYYGVLCEKSRPVSCNLTMIFPMMNSCISSSKYNPKIPGYPNCVRGTNLSSVSWSVKAECKTLTNGTYIDPFYVNGTNMTSTITVNPPNFKYIYNDGNLITSADLRGKLILNFVDYIRPKHKNGGFSFDIKQAHFEGSPIRFSINLDNVPKNYKTSGRWYYEFKLDKPIRSNTIRNVIDDQNWKAPKGTEALNLPLIIGIPVGVVVFAACIWIYYVNKREKHH